MLRNQQEILYVFCVEALFCRVGEFPQKKEGKIPFQVVINHHKFAVFCVLSREAAALSPFLFRRALKFKLSRQKVGRLFHQYRIMCRVMSQQIKIIKKPS